MPAGSGDNDAAPSDNVSGNFDKQLLGQGFASVDGVEHTIDTPGGLSCKVADDDFGFSYIIGDNEVNLGGGASIFRWSMVRQPESSGF